MKVVFDSCVYIDFLRNAQHNQLMSDPTFVRYLSPVVLAELRAGAIKSAAVKSIDKLINPYAKANRIIFLNSNSFYQAGEILSKLRKSKTFVTSSYFNDVLIAISARIIGARLFTLNEKHFKPLVKMIGLDLEVIR